MNSQEFCFWLQGFFEISDEEIISVSPAQVRMIKEHLKLVFNKKTMTIEDLTFPNIEKVDKTQVPVWQEPYFPGKWIRPNSSEPWPTPNVIC